MDSETVTDRIRLLVAQFPSENQAAKAMGVTQPTLNRITSGSRALPRVETLMKIAGFFGTTIDWLLNGKGERPDASAPKRAQIRELEQQLAKLRREVDGG